MKKTLAVAFMAVSLFIAPAAAQEKAPPPEDRIGSLLFPPELIMQHGRALGLSGAQRETITAALGEMQSTIVELEWRLSDAVHELEEALSMTPVDETRAAELLHALFEAEDAVKLTHMIGLVRLKNALTPEQQQMLTELRGDVRGP